VAGRLVGKYREVFVDERQGWKEGQKYQMMQLEHGDADVEEGKREEPHVVEGRNEVGEVKRERLTTTRR
jgi:hypothetical protein